MSSTMDGMRGRTHSRINTARVDATRLGFISNDLDSADKKVYGWSQDLGPIAIEPTINWQEEER